MTLISQAQLQIHLAQVKLLAIDVDGVMTDGGLYYTEDGDELKKFNVKDGLGIKRVMEAGVEVAFITASSSQATFHRATRLGIKHIFIGIEDKLLTLKELCKQLGLPLSQVAYMGDDLIDLAVLQAVGCPITVADAIPDNLETAIYVTLKEGGKGAVREVCDLLLKHAEVAFSSQVNL